MGSVVSVYSYSTCGNGHPWPKPHTTTTNRISTADDGTIMGTYDTREWVVMGNLEEIWRKERGGAQFGVLNLVYYHH